MGVLGLFKRIGRFLRGFSVRDSLPAGAKISIDGSPAVHLCLNENYTAIIRDGDFTGCYKSFRRQLRFLKEWARGSAVLTVVFDGPRSNCKRVNAERAVRYDSAAAQAGRACAQRRGGAATATPSRMEEKDAGESTRSQDKLLREAVHAYSIDALPWVIQACVDEGVDFVVAPSEAEAQIVMRERTRHAQFSGGNDSDFIVQQDGSRHFLRIPASWSPGARHNQYYSRSSLADAKAAAEWSSDNKFIDEFGILGLRVLAYTSPNDYNAGLFKGVGTVTAFKCANEGLVKYIESHGPITSEAEHTAALSFVAKEIVQCSDVSQIEAVSILEQTKLFFGCQPVWDPVHEGVVSAMSIKDMGFTTITEEQGEELTGLTRLRSVGKAVCEQLVAGFRDPRTLEPWDASAVPPGFNELPETPAEASDTDEDADHGGGRGDECTESENIVPVGHMMYGLNPDAGDGNDLIWVTYDTLKQYTRRAKHELRVGMRVKGNLDSYTLAEIQPDDNPDNKPTDPIPLSQVPGMNEELDAITDPFRRANTCSSSEPEPADLAQWSHTKMKQWLRDHGESPGDNRADSLDRIKVAFETGMSRFLAADNGALASARFKTDVEAWSKVKVARQHGVNVDQASSEAIDKLPQLTGKVLDDHLKGVGATTSRFVQQSGTRHVSRCMVHVGATCKSADHNIPYAEVIVTAVVGLSIAEKQDSNRERAERVEQAGHAGRVVVLIAIAHGMSRDGSGGSISCVTGAHCVFPEDMLIGGTVKTGKRSYRLCRQSGSHDCVHIGALLSFWLCFSRRGATDGGSQWANRRATNKNFEKDQPVHRLPFKGCAHYKPYGPQRAVDKDDGVGDDVVDDDAAHVQGAGANTPVGPAETVQWDAGQNVFSPSKLLEMDKGPVHSQVYRRALENYIRVKKSEHIKHGDEHDRRGKPRDLDRRLKIETVLVDIEGCTCRWLPSMQRWIQRCRTCMQIKAIYCHDRGLTRLHAFRKKGIQVYVPGRKASHQTCWTKQSALESKNLASHRIHVERNNQELRCDDAFHGQRTTNQFFLASAIGQVSRLNANLNPVLHSLVAHSTHGVIEISSDSDSDDE